MKLLPIFPSLRENSRFANDPLCAEALQPSIDFYKRVGFQPPWICYFAEEDGQLVGSAGIKGKPVNGKIEIAYGTFEQFRKKGIGAMICRSLVELCQETDNAIIITARTLPEKNFSTRILEKNSFVFTREVIDPEDGLVWEWEHKRET